MSFSVCVSGYRHCEAPSSTPLVDGPFCTYTARHCHHTIFTGTTQPGGTFFSCHFLCLFPAAIGVKTPSSELPSSKTNLKTTHIKSAQEHRPGVLALRHPHPCWASAAFRRLSSVSKKKTAPHAIACVACAFAQSRSDAANTPPRFPCSKRRLGTATDTLELVASQHSLP